ncbi:hypothetical protein QBC34DRAFT_471867 [Podospora aff. communis PSN243]|uniref:Uncharacterized protein n=1 Tax=Podospora aff. communis PSN243 TaxID=3040156 RepID=A0AAV9GC24_9PEZI|nr:hypothetical protein QBC34DRAFT_471867 [Podospora aff. communis PSN243]
MTSSTATPQLSLLEIIHRHSRERLFVHPLLWTPRQCALLDCRFQFHEADDPVDATTETGADKADNNVDKELAEDIALAADTFCQQVAFYHVFTKQGTGLHSNKGKYGGVHLCFGKQQVAYIKCNNILVTSHASNLIAPRVAVLDFGAPGTRRKMRIDRSIGGRRNRHNPPVKFLIQHRIRRLTPQDPRQDPYILALFIAMAQARKAALGPMGLGSDGTWPVTLIMNDCGKAPHVYVYTASVPEGLLLMFENPKKQLPLVGMEIHCTLVKFQSYESLVTRLHRAAL